MSQLGQGISDGLGLIVHGDRDVVRLTLGSLRVAAESTAIAAILGIPAGCALGVGDFRGRRVLLAVANGGLRFPPVAVGWILWLLLFPTSRWGGGPLSGLGWIYTDKAIVLAQTLLALPIVIALTASAVQAVPTALLAQARAFGAPTWRVALLALREARISAFAAVIAAFGVAVSTLGAIIVVGGPASRDLLSSMVLIAWGAGNYPPAIAYGTVLLGLFLVIAAALTLLQQRRDPWLGVRR